VEKFSGLSIFNNGVLTSKLFAAALIISLTSIFTAAIGDSLAASCVTGVMMPAFARSPRVLVNVSVCFVITVFTVGLTGNSSSATALSLIAPVG
jgi:hypothetical protein